MTLRLNGSTSGYVEIDAPAVAGNNTITLPSTPNGSLVALDSNGNLGIGTQNPQTLLHLESGSGVSAYATFGGNNGSPDPFLIGQDTSGLTRLYQTAAQPISFWTSSTERARLDQDGRLLVGTPTSSSTSAYLQVVRNSGTTNILCQSQSLADGQNCGYYVSGKKAGPSAPFCYSELGVIKLGGNTDACSYLRLQAQDGAANYFWADDSDVFRISTASSHIGTYSGSIVGTQTSDERLKNVGGNVSYGLNEVLQLQPKQYALKAEPDTNKLGFIAQEVESIIPEAVFDTGEELEGHQDGDRTRLGMEYVQLIPVLVNAIKEQQATITDLQTRLADLETRLTALEVTP